MKRPNWLEFLDREDMKVCIVEESNMRRILLRSLYKIIGKLDKIRLFLDCDQALAWAHTSLIAHKQKTDWSIVGLEYKKG
jgi:hypothetical protein